MNSFVSELILDSESQVSLKAIEAAIEISSGRQLVWNTLIDFGSFQNWNPYIRHAEGSAIPGKRITIHTQPPGARRLVFRPLILVVEPNSELRWIGSSLPHFLFAGEHSFLLKQIEDGKTKFLQKERFTGLLVPFLGGAIEKRTLAGFKLMNEALKKRVESNQS